MFVLCLIALFVQDCFAQNNTTNLRGCGGNITASCSSAYLETGICGNPCVETCKEVYYHRKVCTCNEAENFNTLSFMTRIFPLCLPLIFLVCVGGFAVRYMCKKPPIVV